MTLRMGCAASTASRNSISDYLGVTLKQHEFTSLRRFTWAYREALVIQQRRLDAKGSAGKVWSRPKYPTGLEDEPAPGFLPGGLAALQGKAQNNPAPKPFRETPIWIHANTPLTAAAASARTPSTDPTSSSGLCEGHAGSLQDAYVRKFRDMSPSLFSMTTKKTDAYGLKYSHTALSSHMQDDTIQMEPIENHESVKNNDDNKNKNATEAAAGVNKQVGRLVHKGRSETCDVTVVVRIRPLSGSEQGKTVFKQEDRTLRLLSSSSPNLSDFNCSRRIFKFDAVMNEKSATLKVFQQTGALAVNDVVDGVSAVIFAYGQTGSGKTYSLLGEAASKEASSNNEKNTGNNKPVSRAGQGIASLTFQSLLQKLNDRAKSENGKKKGLVSYSIEVSAVQIYLNRVYDLFSSNNQALRIRGRTMEVTLTQCGGQICELEPKETYRRCMNNKQFEDLLQQIVSERVQSSTRMNTQSSRSHLIITLAVRRKVSIHARNQDSSHSCFYYTSKPECAIPVYMSKLTLVDLAGNEHGRTEAMPQTVEVHGSVRTKATTQTVEGIDVNLSLSALTACLRERVRHSQHKQKKNEMSEDMLEPKAAGAGSFRQSSLTRLLKEHLTLGKIFFLACCSPSASSSATYQTLRYAAMVKCIKTSAEDHALLLELGMDSFPIRHNFFITLQRVCHPR